MCGCMQNAFVGSTALVGCALIGRAVVVPWAVVGRALVGQALVGPLGAPGPGPSWALNTAGGGVASTQPSTPPYLQVCNRCCAPRL